MRMISDIRNADLLKHAEIDKRGTVELVGPMW